MKKLIPYKPYLYEGLFNVLLIFPMVIVGLLAMYIISKELEVSIILFFLVMPVILGALFFPLSVLCFIELLLGLYTTEELCFESVKECEEWPIFRREPWKRDVYLFPLIYKDKKYVQKSKIRFRRKNGKYIRLRCVFFGDFYRRKTGKGGMPREKDMTETIMYGKLTHIIVKRKYGKIDGTTGLWDRGFSSFQWQSDVETLTRMQKDRLKQIRSGSVK